MVQEDPGSSAGMTTWNRGIVVFGNTLLPTIRFNYFFGDSERILYLKNSVDSWHAAGIPPALIPEYHKPMVTIHHFSVISRVGTDTLLNGLGVVKRRQDAISTEFARLVTMDALGDRQIEAVSLTSHYRE